jgi:hypothetical protein
LSESHPTEAAARDSYVWMLAPSDDQILARLLRLNQQRAGQ